MELLNLAPDPPGESTLLEIGGQLFGALFHGEIRDLWLEAVGDLDSGGRVRIRLTLLNGELSYLPWEILADPGRRRVLAANPRLALIRTQNQIDFVPVVRNLSQSLPIRILLALVDDPEGKRRAEEAQAVREVLTPLQPRQIQLEVMSGRISLENLRKRLEEDSPDLLHIATHGDSDALLMWEEGEPIRVTGTQLAAMLEPFLRLRLVFLNACLGARSRKETPRSSLAHRLLQVGIPAVIAMQFEIEENAAVAFSTHLYRSLVEGECAGSIDRAVSAARDHLFISSPDSLDFATPILWQNIRDGFIFRFDEPRMQQLQVEPAALELDLAEKEAWFGSVPMTIDVKVLKFAYSEQRNQARHHLRGLQLYEKRLRRGLPVDRIALRELLTKFEDERRYLDEMLMRLKQFNE